MHPRRSKRARRDARVATIERSIEKVYGLPKNSVRIVNPDGKDARGDKLIATLREHHAMVENNLKSGKRSYRARDDATVGSIIKDIAMVYGIPEESVQLLNPSGKPARKEKRIGKLREDYILY